MKRFFVYGCGGAGREYMETVKQTNEENHEWDEIYFIVDDPNLHGTKLNGVEVWDFEKYLENGKLENDRFIIAMGEIVNKIAAEEKLKKNNIKLGTVVHPLNGPHDTCEIGEGTMIHYRAVPGTNCKIGKNVLLQGNSLIGHDVVVGDYSTISSFVFIGGDTIIGRNTYIGPGALLRNGIKIGDNCIIGMGSVVTKDIPDNSVAYGNPCKVARENKDGLIFKKK